VLHGNKGGHGHGHGHRGSRFAVRQDNPDRTDDPVLNSLYAVIGPQTAVLDVGGGTGCYAIPLESRAKHVTVVDPSSDSMELLQSIAVERGITNITAITSDWTAAEVKTADIVLCSLVLHHVQDVGPFILKLAQMATDRVLVVVMMEFPGMIETPFYKRVHGSDPIPLPTLPDLIHVFWEMDVYPDLEMFASTLPRLEADKAGALEYLRQRLGVEAETDKDERLQSAMTELLEETPSGLISKGVKPQRLGIASWRPEGVGR
jgi:SAM-dependent methyltransferase